MKKIKNYLIGVLGGVPKSEVDIMRQQYKESILDSALFANKFVDALRKVGFYLDGNYDLRRVCKLKEDK